MIFIHRKEFMMKQTFLYVFSFILIFPLTTSWAYTTAPRISDKEIIQSLTELKAGQKALNQRIDDLNLRINDLNKKLDQRINDLDKKLSQRIDDLNQRIDDLIWFGGVMGGGIFMLITALFGYIVWDRRTMMKPMQEKLEKLEHENLRHLEQVVDHHIGLQQNKGLLHNIHAALKDMAKRDPGLADILKEHSLLP